MKKVTVDLSVLSAWETWEGFVPDNFTIDDIEENWIEYCKMVDSGASNYIVDNIEVEDGF